MIELYSLAILGGLGYLVNQKNQNNNNMEKVIKEEPNKQYSQNFYSYKDVPVNGQKNIHQSNRFFDVKEATQQRANEHVQSKYSKGVVHPDTKEVVYSNLSGQQISKENFTHNNMVPFYSSRQGINQPMLDYSQNNRILDLHSGGEQYAYGKQEVEKKEFFQPQTNLGNVYGTQSQIGSQYREDQINPGTIRIANNIQPFEKEYVGPGLNQGYTTQPSGGFQQNSTQDYLLKTMKNVDDLRTTNNPKKIFEGRPLAPPTEQVGKRTGDIGKFTTTIRKAEGQQYFGSGAPAQAQIRKIDPTIIEKPTDRGMGANNGVSNPTQMQKQQQTIANMQSTNQQLNTFQPLNPKTFDIQKQDEDYNVRNINIKPNERSMAPGFGKSDFKNLLSTDVSKQLLRNSGSQQMHQQQEEFMAEQSNMVTDAVFNGGMNIMNVRAPVPETNTGYNDYQKPNKKEFTTTNGRMYGMMGGNVKGVIQHTSQFQPTVKDTTQNYYQMQQNFRGMETDEKPTIENCDRRQLQYVEGFQGEKSVENQSKMGFRKELPVKQGQMVYNPDEFQAKPTMRQGSQFNTYDGIVGHSQIIKGGHQTEPRDVKGRVAQHTEYFSGLKSNGPAGEEGYLTSSFFNKPPTVTEQQSNRYGGEAIKGKVGRHDAYTGIAGDTMGTYANTKLDTKFEPTSFRQTLKAPRPDVIQEGYKHASGKDNYNFDMGRQLDGVSYRTLNNIQNTYQQPQYDRKFTKGAQTYSEKENLNRFNDPELLNAYRENPYTQKFENVVGSAGPIYPIDKNGLY